MTDSSIAIATGIPLPFVAGIRATESGGNSRVVRFEPHLFARFRPTSIRTLHPTPGAAFVTGDEERRAAWDAGFIPYTHGATRAASDSKLETGRVAFECAYRIDGDAAVRSTSWGSFQVLGGHLLGMAKTAAAAVSLFDADPDRVSDELLVRWLRANPKALEAAKNGGIDEFIHRYNGCPLDETTRYRKRFDPAYVAAGGRL